MATALERYGRDLTTLACKGKLDPVICRDVEIQRTIQILCRRRKSNPMLLGEPGVGKSAIVEGLALRIANGEAPPALQKFRIVALDLVALVAGVKLRGEFEERLMLFINEVTEHDTGIIVFIDEVHTVIGAGNAKGEMDAANILKPALARGELRCIGATTLDEHRRYIEKDPALNRRFQRVMVDPPTVDATVSMLRALKERYEKFHEVLITDAALVAAAKLSHRFIRERFLPDKAIDAIDEAMAARRVEDSSKPECLNLACAKIVLVELEMNSLKNDPGAGSRVKYEKLGIELEKLREEHSTLEEAWKNDDARKRQHIPQAQVCHPKEIGLHSGRSQTVQSDSKASRGMLHVGEEDISRTISAITRIPLEKLNGSERDRLLHLEQHISKHVIGQTEAVKVIAECLRISRAGISNANRPIASLMFMGPSGVGKTEICKVLARLMFDDQGAMIRLDMSEYMERHTVSRLVGAPPGYIGYDDNGGQLTEAVRRRPYSVILFDEIEKAHQDVTNILLQVLDDGRLTDSKGRTVDFTNAIIIFTSNLGSSSVSSGSSTRKTKARERAQNALRAHFKPEFVNRLDETVLFAPLGPSSVRAIAELELQRVSERLERMEMHMTATSPVLDILSTEGYEPAYGARPLRRAVRQLIEIPLSQSILRGDTCGGDEIVADAEKGRIFFTTTCRKEEGFQESAKVASTSSSSSSDDEEEGFAFAS
jgi:ATP-dependent Clp protease ATP-binding subunit ClpB